MGEINLAYLIIGGFFVEILTEMVKKIFNIEGGWVIAFSIVFGIIFAILTPNQGIIHQLKWNCPEISDIIISGVVVSSSGKFLDYAYKLTKMKERRSRYA